MRKPLALTLAGVMLVAAPSLSGCSIIGNLLPGGGNGNPISGGVLPGQGVPDDFPGEVPLIDGEVVLGLSIPGDNGEKAWNVTVNVSGASAFDEIKQQLVDAGFESRDLSSGESGATGAFTKDPYTVLVVVAAGDGDQWTANYTVTNAETGQ